MRKLLIMAITCSALMAETTIIKDTKTNLMWEDTPHVREAKIKQPRAKAYCAELKIGGFEDWRLPTINELLTIVDYSRISPALLKEFSYVDKESFYWTKTAVADEADAFWGINFKRGASSKASEYYDRFARCVRNSK